MHFGTPDGRAASSACADPTRTPNPRDVVSAAIAVIAVTAVTRAFAEIMTSRLQTVRRDRRSFVALERHAAAATAHQSRQRSVGSAFVFIFAARVMSRNAA